jgi:hypothetical protein
LGIGPVCVQNARKASIGAPGNTSSDRVEHDGDAQVIAHKLLILRLFSRKYRQRQAKRQANCANLHEVSATIGFDLY